MDFKCNDDSFDNEIAELRKQLNGIGKSNLTLHEKFLALKNSLKRQEKIHLTRTQILSIVKNHPLKPQDSLNLDGHQECNCQHS